MNPPPEAVARRKPTEVRRLEIVDAAMRILASQGSRRFTVKLLAAEVGLTEGAIFRHFPNMDAIVDGVVARLEALLFAGFPPEADDPLVRLGLFFQNRVRTILANPHIARLMLSDHLAQASGPARAARMEEFKRRSQGFVAQCLLEAKDEGALAEGVSPEAGAVLVLGSMMALATAGGSGRGEAKVSKLAQEVWAALAQALQAGRGEAGGRNVKGG